MYETAIAMGDIGHRARFGRDGKVATGLDRHLSLVPSCPLSLGHNGFDDVSGLKAVDGSPVLCLAAWKAVLID